MKKLYAIVLLALGYADVAMAQDPQFTQFYAAPLYHNPAFAGSAHRGRAIANYRNQWSSVPGAFITYAASVDNYFRPYNSGAGINLSYDRTGTGKLASFNLGGQYAYEMPITKTWAARAGFEFAYKRRALDYGRLVWRDQLSPTGPNQGTSENLNQGGANFFDVSSGILLYSKAFWAGISSAHMNQPNQSLIGENSRLTTRWTVQTGMNIPLSSKRAGKFNNNEVVTSLTPAILYKQQGSFKQVDLGLYMNVQPIVFGAWYRGIPVIKNAARQGINHDALAFLIGVKMPYYSLGYSYDITISQLGPGTGGSHEISLSYEFETGKQFRRKHTAIPCPKF